MLNSLHPPISTASEWPDVRRAVSLDARMAAIPEERRETLFEEVRLEAEQRESLERRQLVEAATTDVAVGGTAAPVPMLDTDDELTVLSALRSEQVCPPCPLSAIICLTHSMKPIIHVIEDTVVCARQDLSSMPLKMLAEEGATCDIA